MSAFSDAFIVRFWNRIRRGGEDECWPWLASCTPKGYGRIGSGRYQYYAHRVAWELAHGPIPDGMFVCHHCDTPCCCNEKHLFLGTNSDNMKDCARKGRLNRQIDPMAGERHGMAKLTEAAVIEIRARRARNETFASIARCFGVRKGTIIHITQRRTWAHVP